MPPTMNQPKIKRDPEGTGRRILLAAAEEFANGGLFGARVDQIARRAETNERMLYYYFGSKEQLFTAVLEHAFSALNEAERTLELNGIAPVEAVTRLAHFVWDYYRDHPELLRLVNNENLHEARYMQKSTRIREMISPIVATLGGILERGQRAGLFPTNVDPLRLYVTLSGMGYYIVVQPLHARSHARPRFQQSRRAQRSDPDEHRTAARLSVAQVAGRRGAGFLG
ncbi:MAG: Transcriptional regulator, AcrR family [uncultured Paraburkholderia sp.]|nr:MAG: Transcriptional regulator, AcrR family [uncultured Paraburkholderia sp.]